MYNAETAVEGTDKTQLPTDSILDGVITNVEDGQVKGFVKNLEKWTGNHDQTAINLTIEVIQLGEVSEVTLIEQVFTYQTNDEGKTVYTPKSNLGKFKWKYGKLPSPGVKVKIITNSDGFGKIKLD